MLPVNYFKINIWNKAFAIFALILFLSQSFNAYSEVFLYPPIGNKSTSQFLYEVKPGDIVKDIVEINNTNNESVNLKINAADGYFTPEGGITSLPQSIRSEKAGSWIKMEAQNLTVSGKGVVKLKFTASIPKDITEGEYLGVIVATPATPKQPEQPLSFDFIKSIKLYFHVKGEYKLSTKASSLNILTPSDTDFASEKEKLPYLGKNSMVVRVNLENAGNVFSRVEGQYKIIQNGKVQKTGTSVFDLYPGSENRNFYIVPNIPYTVGNIRAEFSYKTVPINFKSSEVSITDGDGILNDSTDLSQSEFDLFSPEKVKPFQTEAQRFEILNPSKGDKENVIVKKTNNFSNTLFWLLASILILVCSVLVAAVYIKSRRPVLWDRLVKYFLDVKSLKTSHISTCQKII